MRWQVYGVLFTMMLGCDDQGPVDDPIEDAASWDATDPLLDARLGDGAASRDALLGPLDSALPFDAQTLDAGTLDAETKDTALDAEPKDAMPDDAGRTDVGISPDAEVSVDSEVDEGIAVVDAAPVPDLGPVAVDPPAGFVRVQPGEFWMGSPEDEFGRGFDEHRHRVQITRPFAIKATEVTQMEWAMVVGSNPSEFAGCDDCPVETVSWYESAAFANLLSELGGLQQCYDLGRLCRGVLGEDFECINGIVHAVGPECRGYRLPTEAEWEFAARAGTQTAYYSGPILSVNDECDEPSLDDVAWYLCNAERTQPVGQLLANGNGLFDMLGNVSEWVEDGYSVIYDLEPADLANENHLSVDPFDVRGDCRVVRGGSWVTTPIFSRAASRLGELDRNVRGPLTGLRLVRRRTE